MKSKIYSQITNNELIYVFCENIHLPDNPELTTVYLHEYILLYSHHFNEKAFKSNFFNSNMLGLSAQSLKQRVRVSLLAV